MNGDDDDLSALRDRLHAARRLLAEAYDRRDVIAREVAAVEATGGISIPSDLLSAFAAAERAVLVAEADMRDAEHALAVVGERMP